MPLSPSLHVPPPNPLPDLPGLPLHVLGVLGLGMGPMAAAAAWLGADVDGCDRRAPEPASAAAKAGLTVAPGHDPSHIDGRHVVVPTNVSPDTPEVQAARERGVLHHRSELLDALLRGSQSVAVTGSHGKGTVAALIGFALERLGADPTIVLGVSAPALDGPLRGGRGPVVAEADDADGSIARVSSFVSVITNSWDDHPPFGRSRSENARDIARHAARVPADGRVVAGRARNLGPVVRDVTAPVWRLGHDITAETRSMSMSGRVVELQLRGERTVRAEVRLHGGNITDNVGLAFGALRALDVAPEDAAAALGALDRLSRRLQPVTASGDVLVFDDFGKHPESLAANLEEVRALTSGRVHVIFEPISHQHVLRWQRRWTSVLGAADSVVVLPISERLPYPMPRRAAADWWRRDGLRADAAPDRSTAAAMAAEQCRPGDAVVVFSPFDDDSEMATMIAAQLGADEEPALAELSA